MPSAISSLGAVIYYACEGLNYLPRSVQQIIVLIWLWVMKIVWFASGLIIQMKQPAQELDSKGALEAHSFASVGYLYDIMAYIIGSSISFAIPSFVLEAFFDSHLTDSHLDIGPGTGHFLAKSSKLRSMATANVPFCLVLWDLLEANTQYSKTRALRESEPRARRGARVRGITSSSSLVNIKTAPFDLLGDIPPTAQKTIPTGGFKSISLFYVMHMVPYSSSSSDHHEQAVYKIATSFSNTAKACAKNGIIYGVSILGQAEPQLHTRRGDWGRAIGNDFVKQLQRLGAYNNQYDTCNTFKEGIARAGLHLQRAEVIGQVLLFEVVKK